MTAFDLPKDNIAEVTLIGTGGGYGESCVIHLANQTWIVVDSCVNPNNKKSLPLEYLQKINVNVKKDVKLIVCTHWHDDHILGISQMLELCKNAIFSTARTNDKKKFLQLLSLDYKKLDKEASNSSTVEYNNCLKIIENRSTAIKESAQDKVLLSMLFNDKRNEIISLSPSDYVISEFNNEISTLITDFGAINKKIITKSPNSKSVVLFLKLGDHRAILGADLEVTDDNREGWLSILDNSQIIDKKSSLFKIPHHGSENAYHERIWVELLDIDPVSKLTPWNKNNKLPTLEMLAKISGHSNKVFMTSPITNNAKPKRRDKNIEKTIQKFKRKLREVKFNQGIVRCRVDINNPSSKWEVTLFDSAFHIEK